MKPGRSGSGYLSVAGSINATLRGSGAACFAIDQVFAGKSRNAFCAVRPPGHHAGSNFAMGFCLFNHVAVAASHALAEHHIERVAILDFDVHHGNGTQAIFEHSPEVSVPVQPPDASLPGNGPSGRNRLWKHPQPAAWRPVPAAMNFGQPGQRSACRRCSGFQPDLIIISAGFDAHKSDPLGQLELQDEDYGWITGKSAAMPNLCDGRVISVLEGGYDLDALASASAGSRGGADVLI